MRRHISLPSAFPLVLVGCAIQPARAPETAGGEDIPIIWEQSGSYSRLGRPVHIVARDAATLAQVPIAEVPVDFKTQMVLIAGLGPVPSNELGIRINRVWRDGPRVRVQEHQIHPGPEAASNLQAASPWTLVVIPKSDLNVEGYSAEVPKHTLSSRENALVPHGRGESRERTGGGPQPTRRGGAGRSR